MKVATTIQRVPQKVSALRRDALRYRALVDAAHAYTTGKPLTPRQRAVHDAVLRLGARTGIADLGRAIDGAIAAKGECYSEPYVER